MPQPIADGKSGSSKGEYGRTSASSDASVRIHHRWPVGVSIRDKHGDETEIGVFGVVVTANELRVMTIGDRISFFGAPPLIRDFTLSLPVARQEIPINWSVDRISVEGRFAISRRLCRTSMNPQPFVHEEPEFSLFCRGQSTNHFLIRYWVGNDCDEYVVNLDSRNQAWVIPAHVHEHLSQWFGISDESEVVAGENDGGELREPEDEIKVPAPENAGGDDGESGNDAE